MVFISVPVFKRNENKLQVIVNATDLAKYTIQLCENQTIFPKKTRWTLCSKLINSSIEIVVLARRVNKTRLDIDEEIARERINLQNLLMQEMETLWALMEISKACYNIPITKLEFWSNKALQTDKSLEGWRKSDFKRFKELYCQ